MDNITALSDMPWLSGVISNSSLTKNAKPLPMNLDRASPRIDPFVFLARADWVMQHFIKRNGVITSYQPCTLWPILIQFRPKIACFPIETVENHTTFSVLKLNVSNFPQRWLIRKLRYGKMFQFGIKTIDEILDLK